MLQIDMQMPHDCYVCPFKERGVPFCALEDKNPIQISIVRRPSECPLGEVPEGRKLGRWIRLGTQKYKCSVCGNQSSFYGIEPTRCCPNCGARLRKEVK